MPTHMNLRWIEMDEAMAGARKLQNLAEQYGVSDIFADNGGKVVQLAVATGLDIVPGRLGADCTDRMGNEYELKTVDLAKRAGGYSTNHHLNSHTITKYRARRFVFAEYHGIELHAAYLLMAKDMEPMYTKWVQMLRGKSHLNNPKIPIDFVRERGQIMYLKDVAPQWMDGKRQTTVGRACGVQGTASSKKALA